jgi:soluble lytic murein transglycosylase-like protein
LRNDVGKGRGENQKLRRQVAGLESQLALAELTQASLQSVVQLAAVGMVPGGDDSIANSVGYPMRKLFNGDGPEDALVLTVMKQESAFDPKAVSSKGAMGLMQLMPDTAKQVAGKLKLNFNKSKLTRNADFNIALGRAYLDELLNLFDRSYVLAIAAYNAGPQRVLEWMRAHGDPRDNGVDVTKWVSSIPYPETRNYVRRVMRNLEQYRSRLAGETDQDRCFSLVNVSW